MWYAIKHAYGISEKTSTKERSLNHSSVRAKEVSSPVIWLGLVMFILNAFDWMAVEDNITGFKFKDL